jgi:hypothetical protein
MLSTGGRYQRLAAWWKRLMCHHVWKRIGTGRWLHHEGGKAYDVKCSLCGATGEDAEW